MFSHRRRLYLHPLIAGQTSSGRLTLLLQRIVVERPSVRGFAADCPFLPAFRFAPCAIHVFLSAFAAITLEPVSSLCCGTHGFRGSQQFSLSSCGLSPHASRQLLVRGGHSLPLRFGTGIVVAFERSVVEKTLPQAVRDGCRSFRAFSFLQSFYETAVTDFTVRRYAYVVPKG